MPIPPAAYSQPKIHAKAMAAGALSHTLRHRPRWGNLQCCLDPLAGERGGKAGKGAGKGGIGV